MSRFISTMSNDVTVQLRIQLYTIGIAVGAFIAVVFGLVAKPEHMVLLVPVGMLLVVCGTTMMYVAGLLAWLGWTLFYGSPAVGIGLALLWTLFTVRVIPYEERQLEELFGEDYLVYKRSVRRWLGRA